MQKRGHSPILIYELLHPYAYRNKFFKHRRRDSEVRYKKQLLIFEKQIENPELDQSLVNLVNNLLELDEQNLPQNVNFFFHTNKYYFLNEYSFLKPERRGIEEYIYFYIDDTIKKFVEDAYDSKRYIHGGNDHLFVLGEYERYFLKLRDKKDVERYNKDFERWKDEEENNETVEEPKDPWSITILTRRDPGEYRKLFRDLGLLDYFYINVENIRGKILFEAGNIEAFDLLRESPTLRREKWMRHFPKALQELINMVSQ